MGNYSLIWIVLSLTAVIAVLAVAIRFGIQRDDAGKSRRMALDVRRLRSAFRSAVQTIEANLAERGKRYELPWVVLLHDGEADTRPALEACGLSGVLAGAQPALAQDGARWHFFDRGLVVELEADQLDAPHGQDELEKRWEAFLALCGRYRPQRPLDSIVVSVPAALLADRTPEGRERLRECAAAASRRIWIAQNRYAMRFAVYLMVSGCETVPGFVSFSDALPAGMRDSMLGWSSPYQPAALYRREWTQAAFDQVEQDIADMSAELFASHAQLPAPADLFLLPSRIAALRAGATEYLDELLRPNAFHEPFFLRGLYFTGGGERPAFLRDVLEHKVFAEFGLSRAAHSQKLARPMLSTVGRWVMVGVPVVYALGILLATVQLQRVMPALGEGLEGLKRDAEVRAQATRSGDRLDFDWYRKTALQLMAGLSELQSRRLSAIQSMADPGTVNPFMPGSWPMFDDLRVRAIQRIEENFSDLVVHTLQQAVYRRTAELTNAPLSPVTGRLTNGGDDCDGPHLRTLGMQAVTRASLAPEDLPEFAMLASYAAELDKLGHSVGALQVLSAPHADGPKRLRLLVQDMLGADLTGELSGSVRLFNAAGRKQGTLVDRPAVSLAARCSFAKGMLALNHRLFAENALVRSEEAVQKAKDGLLNLFADSSTPDSGDVIAAFRALQEALSAQKMLLAPGRGLWLANEEMKLGESYDRLVRQFADNPLVGPEITGAALRKARDEFARTRERYLALFDEEGEALATAKDGSLALSKERIALLSAVELVLSQPLMQPAVGNALEATAPGTLVRWDVEQLARALKMADGRRKYLTDELPKFPTELQPAVQDAIDYQYALRLVDLIGHAYSPVGADSTDAAGAPAWFEPANGHLKRLVALLRELGQAGEANSLQAIITNDANARLRLLGAALQEAHLYAVLDDADEPRPAERGTLNLFAASGGDAGEYLNQQLQKLQAMSAHAQLLRSALPADARGSGELARWNGIARELELYAAKDPKASAARLERMLLEFGRELDAPACLAALKASEPPKRPANYFADRHADLHRALLRRCVALDRRSFAEQWTAFASDFNRLLKARRPFVGNRSTLRGSEFAAIAPADLSEAGALLARLPLVSPEIFARNNVPEGAALPVRDFAQQAAQVRQLLAPLFPADGSQPAALDVAVRFRANVNAEIDGNKVIDWALTIGDQSIRLRDAPRALRWKAGDPVRLTLRFANDVPLVPRADPDNPYLEVSRKSVVFRFDGPWSLLDMVQLLRDPAASDARSNVLRLDVPVLADAKDSAPRARPVRAFAAVTLSEPGKTAPLAWPSVFPDKAPLLER